MLTPHDLKTKPIFIEWGYDGGGMACGPVEGSYITEITFVDGDGRLLFVSVTRLMEFVNIYVSETSLYSLLLNLGRGDVDFEHTLNAVEKVSSVTYSAELPFMGGLDDAEYRGEILLALLANDFFCSVDDPGRAQDWLSEFLAGQNRPAWLSYVMTADDEEDEEDED